MYQICWLYILTQVKNIYLGLNEALTHWRVESGKPINGLEKPTAMVCGQLLSLGVDQACLFLLNPVSHDITRVAEN